MWQSDGGRGDGGDVVEELATMVEVVVMVEVTALGKLTALTTGSWWK